MYVLWLVIGTVFSYVHLSVVLEYCDGIAIATFDRLSMNLKYLRLRSSLSLSVNVSLNYNSSDQEKVSQTAKLQFSDKQLRNCHLAIRPTFPKSDEW